MLEQDLSTFYPKDTIILTVTICVYANGCDVKEFVHIQHIPLRDILIR
jgi:hypothetical protein